MNLLDENIPSNQRQLLIGWGIRVHQVGLDAGRKGMKDDEIIPFLLQLRSPTFFTRDMGFAERALCHRRYCLVCMAVDKSEAAVFVRRVLRHHEFDTQAKRMGTVISVSHRSLLVWRWQSEQRDVFAWVE